MCCLVYPNSTITAFFPTSTSLGNTTVNLNVNSSGSDYAFACQSAKDSYFSRISSLNSAITTFTNLSISLSTSVFEQGVGSSSSVLVGNTTVYSLCDRVPRIRATRTVVFASTKTKVYTYTSTLYPPLPFASPSCSINPSDCAILQSSFKGGIPHCTAATVNPATVCPLCHFEVNKARLFYWPVPAEPGYLCGNGSTLTPTPTGNGSNTAVVNGTTFTSPTVYISFDTLVATNFCRTVGRAITNGLLALATPGHLSSMITAADSRFTTRQFNYADLPPNEVPWSAYSAFPGCQNCSTIYDDYNPILAIPSDVHSFDSLWSTCTYDPVYGYGGFYDPPVALTQASALLPATHTPKAVPASLTATPGSTAQPDQPSMTSAAHDTQTPVSQDPAVASTPPHNSILPPSQRASNTGAAIPDPPSNTPLVSPQHTDPPVIPTKPSPQDNPQSSSQHSVAQGTSQNAAAPVQESKPVPSNIPSTVGPGQTRAAPSGSPNSASIIPQAGSLGAGTSAADPPLVSLGAGINAAGPQAATISGHVVSVGPSILYVDGSKVQLSAIVTSGSTLPPVAVVTFGGQTYTAIVPAASSGAVIVGPSATFALLGSATAIAGNTGDGRNADLPNQATTILLPATGNRGSTPASAVIITLSGQTYTAAAPNGADSIITIGSSTLAVSGPAPTIYGHIISAGASNMYVDGTPVPYSQLPRAGPTPGSAAVATIGGQRYTANAPSGSSGVIVIASSTLSVSGAAATISGHTISAGASNIYVDGTPIPFSAIATPGSTPTSTAIITLGGQTYTATVATGSSGVVIIGSSTLSISGPAATIAGQTISLAPAGIVINGSPTSTPSSFVESEALLTLGGQTYTAINPSGSGSVVIIGSSTVTLGTSPVTIGGSIISLGPAGLVVGGSATVPFTATTVPGSAGIGGLIVSGFGTGATQGAGNIGGGNGTQAPSAFTASAARRECWSWIVGCITIGLMLRLTI